MIAVLITQPVQKCESGFFFFDSKLQNQDMQYLYENLSHLLCNLDSTRNIVMGSGTRKPKSQRKSPIYILPEPRSKPDPNPTKTRSDPDPTQPNSTRPEAAVKREDECNLCSLGSLMTRLGQTIISWNRGSDRARNCQLFDLKPKSIASQQWWCCCC